MHLPHDQTIPNIGIKNNCDNILQHENYHEILPTDISFSLRNTNATTENKHYTEPSLNNYQVHLQQPLQLYEAAVVSPPIL